MRCQKSGDVQTVERLNPSSISIFDFLWIRSRDRVDIDISACYLEKAPTTPCWRRCH